MGDALKGVEERQPVGFRIAVAVPSLLLLLRAPYWRLLRDGLRRRQLLPRLLRGGLLLLRGLLLCCLHLLHRLLLQLRLLPLLLPSTPAWSREFIETTGA